MLDVAGAIHDKCPGTPFISAPMLRTVVAAVLAVLLLLELTVSEVLFNDGGATCGKVRQPWQ